MNWDEISKQPHLSEEFMRENANHLNWAHISKIQNLSAHFIEEMKEIVNWTYIWRTQKSMNELLPQYADDENIFLQVSQNPHLSKENILNYEKYLDWKALLLVNPYVQKEMKLEEYEDRIEWSSLHKTATALKCFNLSFLRKYKERLDWMGVTDRFSFLKELLTEELVEEMKDYIHWDLLLIRHEFSNAFLERHQDKINWSIISEMQILTEHFIEKFSNRLDWEGISENQDLSFTFVTKHIHKIDISRLQKNKKRNYTLEQWHYIKQAKKEKKVKSTLFSLTTKLKRKINKGA